MMRDAGQSRAAAIPTSMSLLDARSGSLSDPAFASVFEGRRYVMVRLAYLLTGSSATAEEVVQDAFIRLLERWERIDDPSAYLRVCVVNGCNSWHRRRRVARDHLRRHPIDASGQIDRPDELADALARLTPRRRTMVVLRFYEHLTTAEIARHLKVSEGTVKSTLHRALAELKGALE